ncbi:MAG: hypothetical protein ACR2OZ_14540 [Verrucomicrobiales bacterium]
MKTVSLNIIAAALVSAVVSLAVVQFLRQKTAAPTHAAAKGHEHVAVKAKPTAPAPILSGNPGKPPKPDQTIETVAARLEAVEQALARLQKIVDVLSPDQGSQDRTALFAAEDGYLKADEFFEIEKFAIAGEGYLTFLQNHPQHPDAHDIMKRARDSFQRAGYMDKAFWVQNEILKSFPQERAKDLFDLAMMEKEARRMDDAINHAAESASLASNPEDRLWRLLYRAWFIELRDGPEASLAAYRDVETMIDTAGHRERPLGERARNRIAELEQRIAKGQGKRRPVSALIQ